VAPIRLEQSGPDVLLWIKAVPGASRDQIAGVLAEGGKANNAICKLIARAAGVNSNSVTVESGATHPEKTLRIRDTTIASYAND
jgi:uncharacterized protein YggU (UPF0235/DUF167 family)